MVAEGLGELATYALTGSAVAGLSRAAGLGERGIAIATTMATGSLGGADNAYTLYQEANTAEASEKNARLAAGRGFVGGVTTAIPVTQWALRIERSAELFVPLSRMTLEATAKRNLSTIPGTLFIIISSPYFLQHDAPGLLLASRAGALR